MLTGKFTFALKDHEQIFLMLDALSSTSWPPLDMGKPRGSVSLSYLPSLQPGAIVTMDLKERSTPKGKLMKNTMKDNRSCTWELQL